MQTIYSINQGAACITDGYDRDDVIRRATEYFETQREDDGEYGSWQEEVELVTYDTVTDKETTENLTLSGEAEEGYDMRKEHGTY